MATVTPGMPCWVDLASPDVEASRRFYGELFGWTSQVAAEPEAAGYTTFRKGDKAVAAAGPLMAEGRQPAWTTYFATGDAQATAARVEGIWGKIVMWPTDVLGYGRMALFIDTTGAPFGVWQPGSMPGEEISGAPGSRTWSELMTRNPEGAKEFYADVLGWRSRDTRHDSGNYTVFEVGDTAVAGMMPMNGDGWPADTPPLLDGLLRGRGRGRHGRHGDPVGRLGPSAVHRLPGRAVRHARRSARRQVLDHQVEPEHRPQLTEPGASTS